ncbi:hypothetical protein [Vibrio phage phiKT1019]|nr:hypothetical protein [Vibrio phage phiKT1019]
MLKAQLQLFRDSIDLRGKEPCGKYFEVDGFEILATGMKMEEDGTDDLPHAEKKELKPHEIKFAECVKETFENDILNAQELLGDACPFEVTWVIGDYLIGFVSKQIK